MPDLSFEQYFQNLGCQNIAGLDEVGMGCLAGPVIACAVILNFDNIPKKINDSKKLSAKQRLEISEEIKATAVAYSYGLATVDEIDTINILRAAHLAMKRAVEGLSQKPDALLIDGRFKIDISMLQQNIIKGDQKSYSIGAASILAKVYRDQMMQEYDGVYPGYHFAKHKGYGSVLHRQQLMQKGPSPLHRKSFSWKEVPADSEESLS
jgi:ribonuclease HII